MAFFKNSHKSKAEAIYESEIKPLLASKDGNKHVIMINSFSKFINEFFGAEDKYTAQIDLIITKMQLDGYEILDIKFSSLQNQGVFGVNEGFHTLIIYK